MMMQFLVQVALGEGEEAWEFYQGFMKERGNGR